MTQITVYPRLYTSRSEGLDQLVHSSGDDSVQTLYELHEAIATNTTSWNFRRMVLECAIRLFGDFATWLEDQRRNPYITGYAEQFLNDTIDYIHGGTRLMSVVTWADLVSSAGSVGKVASIASLNPTQVLLGRGETTAHVVQQWCARQGGVEDLLQTLQLLFGRGRRTAA